MKDEPERLDTSKFMKMPNESKIRPAWKLAQVDSIGLFTPRSCVMGHGLETARCALHAAILTTWQLWVQGIFARP
ncbi:MAG: hypothetical protein R6V26_16145 [Roseovarius sp.]